MLWQPTHSRRQMFAMDVHMTRIASLTRSPSIAFDDSTILGDHPVDASRFVCPLPAAVFPVLMPSDHMLQGGDHAATHSCAGAPHLRPPPLPLPPGDARQHSAHQASGAGYALYLIYDPRSLAQALNVCTGLSHLSSLGIVHCRLSSRCVLPACSWGGGSHIQQDLLCGCRYDSEDRGLFLRP